MHCNELYSKKKNIESETETDNHVLDHLFVIQDRLDIKEFNFIHFFVCYFYFNFKLYEITSEENEKLWNDRNCYKFTIQRPFSCALKNNHENNKCKILMEKYFWMQLHNRTFIHDLNLYFHSFLFFSFISFHFGNFAY